MTFIIYFLMYKQKAPVDQLFLEFHTDNDVARIISFLSVSGEGREGGAHTSNLTCVNGALADIQKHITDEAKRRNKDASWQTRGGSTFVTAVNRDQILSTSGEMELLI